MENVEPVDESTSVQVKVKDLTPRSRRVDLTVKVISVSPSREVYSRRDGSTHNVADVVIGDDSGTIIMTLWDDNIEKVSDNDVLNIKNGYVSLFQSSMRLNIGRYGSFEASDEEITEVDKDNDMSEKKFERERRYQRFNSRSRGGYRREGPRRY